MVSAGEKVVTVRVKRVVAVMTGFGGKLGGEDGQAKAAKKAKLVISIGKAVVRVLAGEVVKGNPIMGLAREGRLARTWAGVEGEVAKRS